MRARMFVSKLVEKQKETCNNLIAKGVLLGVVEVRIVSFDSNQFFVKERKFGNLV
jgi:hypothetical protein